MASINVQGSAAAEEAAHWETLIDTLKHLRNVMLGEAFYLNSVRINSSSIQKCCETYWHQGFAERSNDNQMDLTRLQTLMRFTDLVEALEKQPQDRSLLLDLRDRLQYIFPTNVETRTTFRHRAPSQLASPMLDLSIITVAFTDTLIKLCLLLQAHERSKVFNDSVIRTIESQFVRPYCMILWARVRKELRA